MIHHITRATRHLLFWGLIGIALLLSFIRFTLSEIDIYREDLEAIISKEIAAPVKIGHLGAGMRGFRPELLLKQVQVLGIDHGAGAPISIAEIRLSMDLLQSYGHQQMLASSWITLVGVKLGVVRHADGSFGVSGLAASDSEPPYWILQTQQFEILDSQITWMDQTSSLKSTKSSKANSHAKIFNNVEMVLKSDQNGQRHLINLLMKPPKAYAEALSVAMQLRGNFLAPNGIDGLIYLEGKNLQLANLAPGSLPLNLHVSAGKGQTRLWSYWQHSQLQAITGTNKIQQLVLQRPAQPPLTIKHFMHRFNWVQQDTQHWLLRTDQLALDANTLQLANSKFALSGSNDSSQKLTALAIDIPQLDLQQVANTGQFFGASLPIPPAAIQGKLTDFALSLVPETQAFNINGEFDKVSFASFENSAGISNISGKIHGNQLNGSMTLSLNDTALNLPSVFAKPLQLNSLNTRFNWQQDDQDWVITSPKVALKVPDLEADSRLTLKVNRQNYAVWMDLQAAFKGSTTIQSFGRFWPVKLMGNDAVKWLNQAFVKGQVIPRALLFAGAPTDFPFSRKQGVFEFLLDFKGIDLKYAPDWQPVNSIDADVQFYNDGIHINSQQATVEGVKMRQFDINVDSFQTSPFIAVDIKGNPDIRQTLSYLQKSPVKNSVNQFLEVINPQGQAPLDIAIQVPLVENKPLAMKGALQLQNVHLNVLPLSLPVSDVKGVIDFNAEGIVGGQLKAKTLGDDIQVAIQQNAERMRIEVLGHTNIVDLQQQFNTPIWRLASGDSDYKLSLTLPNDKRPASLALSSDLQGIRLRLPDVLAKAPAESKPLNMQMTFGEQQMLPIHLQLGKFLKASATVNTKTKHLSAADLLIGAGELDKLPAKGGHLDLNLTPCNLMDWLDLAETTTADDLSPEPFFNNIALQTKQVQWQGQSLGNLTANLHHVANTWQIEFDSPVIKGQIQKPTLTKLDQPTLVDLDYINLSTLGHLKAAVAPKPSAQRLPLFNLSAKQLLWEGVNMGGVTIETARIPNGLAFKQFNLSNGQGGLDLTGNWIATADSQTTDVIGKLRLRKFGDFLSNLKITQDLKGTDAKADIAVNWPGAPQHFALENLQGKVEIELTNGRILSIEPGFGRLLGFLAFEQWGRRLRLDFSDMLSEGLTFNSIKGRFDLQSAEAVTTNLVVNAVPALVNIKGVAHLAERTMDYHAEVLPKSSAALPIAGTIVDRIVTSSLEAITGNSQAGFLLGSEYKILGAWQNPQVIRLREKDGLLQKTWYGLTDFSWLQKNTKPH